MKCLLFIIALGVISFTSCEKSKGFTDPVPEPPVGPPVTDTVPTLATARSWLADKMLRNKRPPCSTT